MSHHKINANKVHCRHCGMPKGTSQAEETVKNFKPVALAVIELHLPEKISQLPSQYKFL